MKKIKKDKKESLRKSDKGEPQTAVFSFNTRLEYR
jgi:hypothetical protein